MIRDKRRQLWLQSVQSALYRATQSSVSAQRLGELCGVVSPHVWARQKRCSGSVNDNVRNQNFGNLQTNRWNQADEALNDELILFYRYFSDWRISRNRIEWSYTAELCSKRRGFYSRINWTTVSRLILSPERNSFLWILVGGDRSSKVVGASEAIETSRNWSHTLQKRPWRPLPCRFWYQELIEFKLGFWWISRFKHDDVSVQVGRIAKKKLQRILVTWPQIFRNLFYSQ